jgi:uncharacterized membrane protein
MGNLKGISYMLACTLLTAFGQYFLKLGVSNIISINMLIGLSLYGLGAILMILALKQGDLNALYPIVSLTIVWVSILSFFLLGEELSSHKLLGTGTILFGIFFITKGGAR